MMHRISAVTPAVHSPTYFPVHLSQAASMSLRISARRFGGDATTRKIMLPRRSDLRSDSFEARFDALKGHFHSPFDFGHGLVTRPRHVQRRFRRRLELLQIPQDLTGKTVLDIGAWDGYFSFEFERRGAKRVLAIDSYSWDPRPEGYPRGLDCFLLAREFFNSKVEHRRLDVHELSPEAIGTFDLVFCAGVLYHMRHPLLGLEKIRSVTERQLILETHQLIPAFHE